MCPKNVIIQMLQILQRFHCMTFTLGNTSVTNVTLDNYPIGIYRRSLMNVTENTNATNEVTLDNYPIGIHSATSATSATGDTTVATSTRNSNNANLLNGILFQMAHYINLYQPLVVDLDRQNDTTTPIPSAPIEPSAPIDLSTFAPSDTRGVIGTNDTSGTLDTIDTSDANQIGDTFQTNDIANCQHYKPIFVLLDEKLNIENQVNDMDIKEQECCICLEEFDKTEEGVKRNICILKPCDHEFCQECVMKLILSSEERFKCPLCRSIVETTEICKL